MSSIDLKKTLQDTSNLVEPVINKILSDGVSSDNCDMVLHQIKSGGKRIRPALVVITGQMFGAKIKDLLAPAASAEIMHNATLITDDIIDHSEFRRDQPTTWMKYGKSMAECMVLDYSAAVFEGLSGHSCSDTLTKLYSRTLKVIIDGEIKDILFERSGREDEPFVVSNRYENISTQDYYLMIGQKTAELLKMCCKAGAISANAKENEIEAVGRFGYNIGIAFQIKDDILDIFGDQKEFGKQIGKDIIEKKAGNFVILHTLSKVTSKQKNYILSAFNKDTAISDEEVSVITSIISATDAQKVAEQAVHEYITKAIESLRFLPDNQYRALLHELADYISTRSK